jgi:hypothetical protein
MGILQDLFTNKDAQDAATAQNTAIQTGTGQATTSLASGLSGATSAYGAGLAPTTTNLAQDQAGQTAYGNATGANGAAGNAAAVAAFQQGPGYQYALDQASQNAMRNQSATGALNSGATQADLSNLGTQAANQGWQQYITNLQPFVGASTTNAGTAASLGAGLGNLTNTNQTNLANLQYGSNVAQGNNQASADLASQAAAKNIFGAVGTGVSLAAGLGGMGGGSGFGGSSLPTFGPTSVGGAPLSSSGSLSSWFG